MSPAHGLSADVFDRIVEAHMGQPRIVRPGNAARVNRDVADRLDEVARLFAAQGASRFRVRAYERAAGTLRGLPVPVSRDLRATRT